MKKIIILTVALTFMFAGIFVFAEEQPSQTLSGTPVFDATCIQNAIEKRDAALIAGWDIFSGAVKTALQTRKDTLKTAWGKATKAERKAAVKAAWDTYKKSARDARTTMKKVKKDAWNQFRKDRVGCKNREINSLEGGVGEGVDVNL